ncbi:MAG: hypothetical protein LQ345_002097 [Seirophora villosa]|nr:MAG: hypothetical protein LQ345_002097 [Seirophora villosa]
MADIDRNGPNDVEAKQTSFDDYDAKFQIEFFRFYHSDSAAFIYNRAMAQGQGALDISPSETSVTHSSCPNQLDSPITKVILTSRDLPEESYSQAWFLEYLDGTA